MSHLHFFLLLSLDACRYIQLSEGPIQVHAGMMVAKDGSSHSFAIKHTCPTKDYEICHAGNYHVNFVIEIIKQRTELNFMHTIVDLCIAMCVKGYSFQIEEYYIRSFK